MHDTGGSALPFSSLCLERMSQSGSEVPLDEFPVSLDTPTTLETGANCHEVHQRVSQFTSKLVPNGMIRSLRDLMTEARAKRELLLSKIVCFWKMKWSSLFCLAVLMIFLLNANNQKLPLDIVRNRSSLLRSIEKAGGFPQLPGFRHGRSHQADTSARYGSLKCGDCKMRGFERYIYVNGSTAYAYPHARRPSRVTEGCITTHSLFTLTTLS